MVAYKKNVYFDTVIRDEEPGTYLLRDSQSQTSYFTVSFVNITKHVQHLRINYMMEKFRFQMSPNETVSIDDSIAYATVLGLSKL